MKKLVMVLLLALVPALLFLELIGWASTKLVPSLYGSPQLAAAIASVEPSRFTAFMATTGSPTLGWDNPAGSVATTQDCRGGTHPVTTDAGRARVFAGYDAAAATTLLIGDSYTHGDEVGDDSTIAAHLWRNHGIMAANLGVGGYSPLQAVLKARERVAAYPAATTVVLGVMYENLRRNVNGYVPSWTFIDLAHTPFIFGLRPYMAGTTFHPLEPGTLAELPAFQARALDALHTDFWARPMPNFPHGVSLLRALASNSGMSRIRSRPYKMRGRFYEADFHDERLTLPLFAVVEAFFQWADSQRLKPLVVFVPQNSLDRTSGSLWVNAFAPRLPGNGRVVDARLDGVDWARFNQKPDPDCHPSSYGYAAIAAAYAAELAALPRQSAP